MNEGNERMTATEVAASRGPSPLLTGTQPGGFSRPMSTTPCQAPNRTTIAEQLTQALLQISVLEQHMDAASINIGELAGHIAQIKNELNLD